LLLSLGLVPSGFQAWVGRPHPSDQYLIENLLRHEGYYRGLVMAKAAGRGADTTGEVWIEESERERGEVGEREWSSKGYAYDTGGLSPLVGSLDELESGERAVAYRRVKGNWYLYYFKTFEKPE
jgi:hypothetical protein